MKDLQEMKDLHDMTKIQNKIPETSFLKKNISSGSPGERVKNISPGTNICPGENDFPVPLGNIRSYSAMCLDSDFQKGHKKKKTNSLSDGDIRKLRHDYKKSKTQRKKKIGQKYKPVSYCGTRLIKSAGIVHMVEGEKGSIYYSGMQRCGSIWFCPDCMYKLMKIRAEELYKQLKIYKDTGKTVLFITFTLQHSKGDRLADLHKKLLQAFNYANTHRSWVNAKSKFSFEFLRTLEVLFGLNGWHPHLHTLFVGNSDMLEKVQIFIDLYKKALTKYGLLINDHTVTIDKWNGKMDDMTEYMFKGKLEEELTSGGIKKSGQGKTFFELIDEDNDIATDEYIKVMKGKRQYHHSKGFFSAVRVKSNEEILKDDKTEKVLFYIPKPIYDDINVKGIALHLLNEYEYGGIPLMRKLLELYDCDTSFIHDG